MNDATLIPLQGKITGHEIYLMLAKNILALRPGNIPSEIFR